MSCDKCHEIYEVYANIEGFKPETAPEGYLLQLIRQMADIAKQDSCQ